MTSGNFRLRVIQNWRLAMIVHQPIPSLFIQSRLHQQSSGTEYTQNPSSQNYLSLLVTSENALFNNIEKQPPTSNISLAIITNNKSLAAIFPFKLEELLSMPLFNEAVLEEKPITAIYTNAKVDGYFIKLILDSKIITADRTTKTPIGKIDDFPIKVNGIIVLIKVLIMKATQYQALVAKTVNTHRYQPCVHSLSSLTIKKKNLPEKSIKSSGPTLTTTNYHQYHYKTTKKRKEEKKNLLRKPTKVIGIMITRKGKEKEKKLIPTTTTVYIPYTYIPLQPSNYH
ncbi:hypothetical protein G9A89_015508 [Geosiphon pyriformis]|nr:hypothetical protein G9A89_015508 [Geosiphon pyriformis]